MANEDFTTYTEVDDADDITVTSSKVTATSMQLLVFSYVSDDKGINHFAGDFEHKFTTEFSNAVGSAGECAAWHLCNTLGGYHYYSGYSRKYNHLTIVLMISVPTIQLWENNGSENNVTDDYGGSVSTTYYMTVKRDENVGDYGTAYLYIYSDSGRTNLLDTLTITLQAKQDFRYVCVMNAEGYNSIHAINAYTENLDLQEEEGVTVPIMAHHYRMLRAS